MKLRDEVPFRYSAVSLFLFPHIKVIHILLDNIPFVYLAENTSFHRLSVFLYVADLIDNTFRGFLQMFTGGLVNKHLGTRMEACYMPAVGVHMAGRMRFCTLTCNTKRFYRQVRFRAPVEPFLSIKSDPCK